MLLNFARGGAAINVLARQAGARVVVVDMGVEHAAAGAPRRSERRRIGAGTANFARGPAMTRAQARRRAWRPARSIARRARRATASA